MKEIINEYLEPYMNGEKSFKSIGNLKSTLRKREPNIFNVIENLNGKTFQEKVWLILNDKTEAPLCQWCKEKTARFSSIKDGYDECCSKNCKMMFKYGTLQIMEVETIKEKVKKTNNEKYGGNAPICSDEVKEKIKKTNNEKYGVDHFSKTEEYKDKVEATYLEHYGSTHYMKTDEGKNCKMETRKYKRYYSKDF
jgi:hypothetical protein